MNARTHITSLGTKMSRIKSCAPASVALALLLVLGTAAMLPAQGANVRLIDAHVARDMARQHLPRMAVGIYKDVKIALGKV